MPTLKDIMNYGLLATGPQNSLKSLLGQPPVLLGQNALAPQDDEAKFQQWIKGTGWYNEFTQNYGGPPDLSPNSDYDYRAAWKAGVVPERDPYDNNRYHWPSMNPQTGGMLKAPNHPTLWMEHFMRETGQNPEALGIKSPEEAEIWKRSRR